ncbi:WD40-repeat-containing domain protein [Suillus americanus]|nr:WD40-repeat-containing domain protein [Suillus americanus]
MSEAVPITTPIRVYQEDTEEIIKTIAVFPHRQRMVTGSGTTLRLWDLRDFVVLKEMEGHRSDVHAVAVSRDGRLIASGDQEGKLIAWHGRTSKPLTQPYECIDAHSKCICSLDFSPDCTMMASGSFDQTIKLWSTETWQVKGDPIRCGDLVCCVRYSPSGEFLAIATDLDIVIYNSSTRESVANLKGPTSSNVSLAWTPDSTCLLSAGDHRDPTIREWDASTWTQIGDPWTGHTEGITAIAINFGGTMVASASRDNHVHLWQLSNRRTIAVFKHSDSVNCVTFTMNGRHILSGGDDRKISEWEAEVCRALIVAVEKVAGFSNLPQAHVDALRMRDFLVKCEKLSASSLKDSSEVQSSINEDSPARSSEPLATDDMYRTSSPDTYLPTCTLDCPLTLPEERVKPHVVSLSACRDDELVYDDNVTGETSTKFFIDYLERNPEASYHDLLSYIRHKVDGITRRRTEVETTTHETRRQSEVEVLDWRKPDRVEKENEDSSLISQRPSYSSHYRLDMLQMVDL